MEEEEKGTISEAREGWQNTVLNHLMLRYTKAKKQMTNHKTFFFFFSPPFLLLLQTRVYPKTLACESNGKAYGYDSLPVVEVTFRRVCDGWFPRVGILRARAESNWLSIGEEFEFIAKREKEKKRTGTIGP